MIIFNAVDKWYRFEIVDRIIIFTHEKMGAC